MFLVFLFVFWHVDALTIVFNEDLYFVIESRVIGEYIYKSITKETQRIVLARQGLVLTTHCFNICINIKSWY